MSEPWILGIASSHNGSACLLHGNHIAVAVQEERLLRRKRALHPGAFPSLAIQYCLDTAGIRAQDLSAVALCASETAHIPDEDIRNNPQLNTARHNIAVMTVPHHLGHAVAAYATSGFEAGSVLVIDGCGSLWEDLPPEEQMAVPAPQLARVSCSSDGPDRMSQPREVVSMYAVEYGRFTPIEKHISGESPPGPRTPGMMPFASLGNMYAAVGLQIFGNFLDGPGKVMGLAPFGRPAIPIEEFYTVMEWGFDFQTGVIARFPHDERWPRHSAEYRDLAASVQAAIEEGILVLCDRLRRRHSHPVLCYGGGVALNSVANERIVRESGFADLFIMPAAEDSGTSIGAAYYALWQLDGFRRGLRQRVDSVGKSYSADDVGRAIRSSPGIVAHTPAKLIETVCRLLEAGKIVGWFQGGSELGPRSLGQRSILCDPRQPAMKDILNQKVKFREGFRPFAPMILEEDVAEWFEVEPGRAASPFMLRVMRFRPEQAARVPAVVHVDGTGRVQTVSATATPSLYQLLTAWKQISGVPILLNTSFNIAGEPIVETPDDALWCMLYTDIDCCILEKQLVTKTITADGLLDCILLPRWRSYSLYDANNCVNSGIRIPELAAEPERIESAHLARTPQLEKRFRVDHLRIVVGKSWGEVVHGISPAFIRILDLVNCRRTAREIFEALGGSYTVKQPSAYSLSLFKRHLGVLRRADAIALAATAAMEATAASTATEGCKLSA
jgi:carbamoyltransferase